MHIYYRTADAHASERDSHLCSPLELYEFLWLFFLFVRSRFVAVPEDLVNSYHLLLCILDHIYACVYVSRRIDLLNPTFEGSLRPITVYFGGLLVLLAYPKF